MLTHNEHPQERMADQRGDVVAEGPRLHRRDVIREALPVPRYGEGEHLLWQILDIGEQPAEARDLRRPDRREAETAIADQHGGDAVMGDRVAGRLPELRGVVMCMGVDEA